MKDLLKAVGVGIATTIGVNLGITAGAHMLEVGQRAAKNVVARAAKAVEPTPAQKRVVAQWVAKCQPSKSGTHAFRTSGRLYTWSAPARVSLDGTLRGKVFRDIDGVSVGEFILDREGVVRTMPGPMMTFLQIPLEIP